MQGEDEQLHDIAAASDVACGSESEGERVSLLDSFQLMIMLKLAQVERWRSFCASETMNERIAINQ
jgi:hypothetical protein